MMVSLSKLRSESKLTHKKSVNKSLKKQSLYRWIYCAVTCIRSLKYPCNVQIVVYISLTQLRKAGRDYRPQTFDSEV